ncbi:hypothetical protein HK103_001080 [Boothiomyces macroporosus]|uniref:Protein YIP n=1 Tax=Boothiomyces macroporosus TaxID=261099 RepID=A0AAD5UEK0_9FUNG|nr:hypothetical protein HK103_001080 [Boothiomyces macroporosus]
MANQDDQEHLLEIDPFQQDESSQLEFQNFMLSSAEEDLLAGKIPSPQQAKQQLSQPTPAPVESSSAFWTIDYWKYYFRVETKDVKNRMVLAMIPQKSILAEIADNPDFYGPFWIPATVVFCLFATSTVAQSIAHREANQQYIVDITMLSFASVAVYTYVLAVPAIIYALAKYYKANAVKLFDLINVYGYGMTIWIPTSIFCVLPFDFTRWILWIDYGYRGCVPDCSRASL